MRSHSDRPGPAARCTRVLIVPSPERQAGKFVLPEEYGKYSGELGEIPEA